LSGDQIQLAGYYNKSTNHLSSFQILDDVKDLENHKQIKSVIKDEELKIFEVNGNGKKGKTKKTDAMILLI